MQIHEQFNKSHLLFFYNVNKGWDIIPLIDDNDCQRSPNQLKTNNYCLMLDKLDIYKYNKEKCAYNKSFEHMKNSVILNNKKNACYLLDIDHIINLNWAKTESVSMYSYYLIKLHIAHIISPEDETILLSFGGDPPLETYAIAFYEGFSSDDIKNTYNFVNWRFHHDTQLFKLSRIKTLGTITKKITIEGIYPIDDLLKEDKEPVMVHNDFNIMLD